VTECDEFYHWYKSFSATGCVPILVLYLQEVPVSGTITLIGVMLKLGGYFRPRGPWLSLPEEGSSAGFRNV